MIIVSILSGENEVLWSATTACVPLDKFAERYKR